MYKLAVAMFRPTLNTIPVATLLENSCAMSMLEVTRAYKAHTPRASTFKLLNTHKYNVHTRDTWYRVQMPRVGAVHRHGEYKSVAIVATISHREAKVTQFSRLCT